jgi:hypothetical protein
MLLGTGYALKSSDLGETQIGSIPTKITINSFGRNSSIIAKSTP